jgi:hypothetical protein
MAVDPHRLREAAGGVDLGNLMKAGPWKQYVEPMFQKADPGSLGVQDRLRHGSDEARHDDHVRRQEHIYCSEGVIMRNGRREAPACLDCRRAQRAARSSSPATATRPFMKGKTGQLGAVQFVDENTAPSRSARMR